LVGVSYFVPGGRALPFSFLRWRMVWVCRRAWSSTSRIATLPDVTTMALRPAGGLDRADWAKQL